MKRIKIKFSGMGGNFNPNNNFIINILKNRYIVELSEEPDYLIYSVNSKDYLKFDCIRIFYTAENLVPDFNICDYGIGFHYMSFGDRYIRFPLYLVDGFKAYEGDDYASDLQLALHKHESIGVESIVKEKFCAFVYSNAQAATCREKMFDALSQYKKVDSGGRYRNNVGGPIADKLSFQRQHKFTIAFENTATPGYTTEKIVGAFAAKTVPIYWGNPEISKEFNAGSYIDCNAYGLTEQGEPEIIGHIIQEIKRIDQNEELYIKMLQTPAFADKNDIKKQRCDFADFLYHIFDQPIEKAYRRNRYYWGERYERKQKLGNSFYWLCRKFIPIRDAARKLLETRFSTTH